MNANGRSKRGRPGTEAICEGVIANALQNLQLGTPILVMQACDSLMDGDFISQPWRKISTAARSPRLRDKIWEWPGDEAKGCQCASNINWAADSQVALVSNRAVGAGPAGPAAAGPIFGQLTRAKMPYELWWIVELLL